MRVEDYFPQGIATGDSFLGRNEDMKNLHQNIETGHHTLLLAPRRYGKTSLVVNALAKMELPYVSIDLHLAVTSKSVEKKILKSAQKLIGLVISKPEQALKIIQGFFNKSNKKWTLGFKGVAGVELTPEKDDDIPENILTTLNLVEEVLSKKNKHAVIFIDEVQEIETLPDGKQIAGAIRHFAQEPKRHLIFIFSGSNRRLLSQMFDDRTAPLFELCEKLTIERLAPALYKKYLNKVSKKTWSKDLDIATFNRIIAISQCHPKRVYNICYHLWRACLSHNCSPSANDVDDTWQIFINKQIRNVRFNLGQLSIGKIKVLTLIATGKHHELTGQKAIKVAEMSGSAISKALQALEDNDYIEKSVDDGHYITDPLIRDVLVFYENENI